MSKRRQGGRSWEIGVDIYTVLYTKQITNMDPLYSTGNSTLCCNGLYGKRVLKRVTVCVYLVAGALCCTAETNITL